MIDLTKILSLKLINQLEVFDSSSSYSYFNNKNFNLTDLVSTRIQKSEPLILDENPDFTEFNVHVEKLIDKGTTGSIYSAYNRNKQYIVKQTEIDGLLEISNVELSSIEYKNLITKLGFEYDGRAISDNIVPLYQTIIKPEFHLNKYGYFGRVEYIIGKLMSELIDRELTINFVYINDYKLIKGLRTEVTNKLKLASDAKIYYTKVYESILMEKLDSTLHYRYDLIQKDEIIIQILASIYIMQKLYKIKHNDLKVDNIFIHYITENDYYKGQRLMDIKYFEYNLGDHKIYIQNVGIIVKVGDYGLSVAYDVNNRMISNKDIMNGCYSKLSTLYNPTYDIYTLVKSCNSYLLTNKRITNGYNLLIGVTIGQYLLDNKLIKNPSTILDNKFMFDKKIRSILKFERHEYEPNSNLYKYFTIDNILTSDFLNKFKYKPNVNDNEILILTKL